MAVRRPAGQHTPPYTGAHAASVRPAPLRFQPRRGNNAKYREPRRDGI